MKNQNVLSNWIMGAKKKDNSRDVYRGNGPFKQLEHLGSCSFLSFGFF